MTASYVPVSGTHTADTSAPVAAMASATVPNTGTSWPASSTVWPALRGLVPPTTLVPTSIIRAPCLRPSVIARRRKRSNSLYKKELTNYEGPGQDAGQVTVATAEWVSWYNEDRLHSACGNIPPTEYENSWLARKEHTIIMPEAKAS
jgi:transposase InsO family protein